jgi:hypothetical protein
MRLAYKLFAAFSLTSLLIVALMVGTMQYFAYRHFTQFVGRLEMQRLDSIIDTLGDEYRGQNGWDRLTRDKGLWSEIIVSRLRPGKLPHELPPDFGAEDRPKPGTGPGRPEMGERGEPGGRRLHRLSRHAEQRWRGSRISSTCAALQCDISADTLETPFFLLPPTALRPSWPGTG